MNFRENIRKKDETSLKTEIATYNRLRDELLKGVDGDGSDWYALIKGTEVIGTYSGYDDALSMGYERFGDNPFLVRKIARLDTVNYITRLAVGA